MSFLIFSLIIFVLLYILGDVNKKYIYTWILLSFSAENIFSLVG